MLKSRFLVGLLTGILATASNSAAGQQAPLKLTSEVRSQDIVDWGRTLAVPVECKPISDIKKTYVCLTEGQALLTQLMGRVSFFTEGDFGHIVVSETDRRYVNSPQAKYDGHDIMASDLRAFLALIDRECAHDQGICLNALESGLRTEVIADADHRHYENYVVIAAIGTASNLGLVVSHELLHARFFLNAQYQKQIKKYWRKNVTVVDKTAIAKLLKQHYNVDGPAGEQLLLNEFQAYVLEQGAEGDMLKDFAPAHAQRLASALRKQQLLP